METAKKGQITSLFQKIKERTKSQDDSKSHALFSSHNSRAKRHFLRFGAEKPLQRLGLILKEVLSYKLRIDLGYVRDLYKLVRVFDGTCLPTN